MHRLLSIIAIFALSFLVTSQLLRLFRGEADLTTWVLLGVGVAGFVGVLRIRQRLVPPNQ